jgi:hypothetical protein
MLTSTIPLSFALALSLSLARSLPLSLSFFISIALACLWQRQAWQTRFGEPGSGSIKGPTLLPQLTPFRTGVVRLLSFYPDINPVINNLGATITHAQHKMHFCILVPQLLKFYKIRFEFFIKVGYQFLNTNNFIIIIIIIIIPLFGV